MKVSQLLNQDKVTLSFEVFPPKTSSSYESVAHATQEIAALRPDFMSVTYGAGGGTSEHTVNIAADLKKKYDVTVLTHLTCVSSTREHVAAMVKKYKDAGIENILALRGDIPEGGAPHSDYHYAAELVRDIKSQGDFCVGGACYPEGHVEAANKTEDILHLKEKVDAGCEFLTTQMFFDNNIMYNFLYRIREKGITVPVVAGIMPVTNVKQIKRITSMSGTYLPERFKAIVDRFRRQPGGDEAGGRDLRDRADHRPDRERRQPHPRLLDEQAGDCRRYSGQPVGDSRSDLTCDRMRSASATWVITARSRMRL